MTDCDVRSRYGPATLELLESQRSVLDFKEEPVATLLRGVSEGCGSTDTLLDTMLATCQSGSASVPSCSGNADVCSVGPGDMNDSTGDA